MKCPICNKELEIKNKKIGETENGEAIYNEFAICHDCKKQWNLDKQRAKSNTVKKEAQKEPVKNTNPEQKRPVRKKRPVEKAADEPVVRTSSSKAVSNSEDAAQATSAPAPRKKKKRPVAQNPAAVPAGSETDTDMPRKRKRPAAPSEANAANAQDRPVRKKRPAPKPAENVGSAASEEKRRPAGKPDEASRPVKKRVRPATGTEDREVTALEKAEPAKAHQITGTESAKDRPVRKKRPAPVKAAEPQDNAPILPTAEASSPNTASEPPKKRKRPIQNDEASKSDTAMLAASIHEFSDALEEDLDAQSNTRGYDNLDPELEDIMTDVEEPTYSNIPPKHIRESREEEMRENYQNMLDEGEEEERHFPIIPVIIGLLVIAACLAAAYYFFFLK